MKKQLILITLSILCLSSHLLANNPPGIEIESAYTSEYWNQVAGGNKKGQAFLGVLSSSINVDLETLFSIQNTHLFVSGLAIHGQSVNRLNTSFQGISNLEADAQTKLYEAFIEHTLFSDTKHSSRFKAGLIDLNSEFDVIEFASLFSNPSHGIGPDFSQSGEAGPSIYPDSTLAFLVDQKLLADTHLKLGLFDAVATNGKNTFGNRLSLKNRDGYLITTELIFKNKSNPLLEQLSLGVWHYTSAFDTYNGQKKHHNQGLYVSLQSDFRNNQETGLTSFVRTGFAKDTFNQSQAYLGLGGVYYGLFQERPHDQLGLAVGTSFLSDAYKKTQTSSLESLESIIEFSYLIQMCDTFFIQPMISHVINPGFETNKKNATLFGLKVEHSF